MDGVRVRRSRRPPVFPDDQPRLAALRLQDGASAESRSPALWSSWHRLVHGRRNHAVRAVVQSAGNGYRLESSVVKREFALGGSLQHLALRYTQALITQMAQTAVCNRHHALDSNYAVGCC